MRSRALKPRQRSRTPEPPQPQADLYPNPTSGEVTVSVEGEVQSVVILNMMGQPVGGWGLRAMEPGRVTIDVGPLPAGPFFRCNVRIIQSGTYIS